MVRCLLERKTRYEEVKEGKEKNVRVEKDTLGEIEVPDDALYGAQTARAAQNFPISGEGIGDPFTGNKDRHL